MSNKPILFFSPNCNHCIKLWNDLKKKNILNSIIKINVTNNKNIPKNIKSVPTLIIKGRQPMTGDAIYFFFNNFVPGESESKSESQSDTKITESNDNSGISHFLPGEMGNNWSDQYSFIGNSNPINHSYSFLGTKNSGIPKQNKINKGSKPKKLNINLDISSRLEEFKNARSKDYSR